MKELDLLVKEYFESRERLQAFLSGIEIRKSEDSALLEYFLSLLKDSFFEAKVFELLLYLNPSEAKRYINLYYLQGNPYEKERYKGNLDGMRDDYKSVLGEMEFSKLIGSISKENKDFYVIKEAIDFANDE